MWHIYQLSGNYETLQHSCEEQALTDVAAEPARAMHGPSVNCAQQLANLSGFQVHTGTDAAQKRGHTTQQTLV